MRTYPIVCALVEEVSGRRGLSTHNQKTATLLLGPGIFQNLHSNDGIDRDRYREEEHCIDHRAESGDIGGKNSLHVPELVENSKCVYSKV